MSNSSRPHDDAVVELLREDPALVDEYLAAALEDADKEGGRQGLLAALRHVAEAQGMANVAERCWRYSMRPDPSLACIAHCQPDSPKPTVKTLPTHRQR
ncbi:helix-turn-helix domain-containing transcriptional regulator [Duganella phyllosphaerae]|uniref:Addiction module antidote protein n=1 Tax=Duganella phyllosphaerae TaxID=762836 RepID=A0A1E7WVP8_9BURK|nr:hypothetical protein [Duganella phyllosphaerae]OFA03898.1 hypothetical protein DUPY_17130 [Duganella phyllosphaerae]